VTSHSLIFLIPPLEQQLVAGSYGIEARYPFLDVDVVQEFLWLSVDVKNGGYKKPVHDLLQFLDCPIDKDKKVGFSANPEQQGDWEVEADETVVSLPNNCGELFDAKGMKNYGLTKVKNVTHTGRMLHSLIEVVPDCPAYVAEYARFLVEYGDKLAGEKMLEEVEKDFAATATTTKVETNKARFIHSSGGVTPIKVATFATKATKSLDILSQTATNGRVSLDILGIGDGWKEGDETTRRLETILEYLERMGDKQLILLVENSDILLAPDLRLLPKMYKDEGAVVVLHNSTKMFLGRAENLKTVMSDLLMWERLYVTREPTRSEATIFYCYLGASLLVRSVPRIFKI